MRQRLSQSGSLPADDQQGGILFALASMRRRRQARMHEHTFAANLYWFLYACVHAWCMCVFRVYSHTCTHRRIIQLCSVCAHVRSQCGGEYENNVLSVRMCLCCTPAHNTRTHTHSTGVIRATKYNMRVCVVSCGRRRCVLLLALAPRVYVCVYACVRVCEASSHKILRLRGCAASSQDACVRF